jgi:hypothetical protein
MLLSLLHDVREIAKPARRASPLWWVASSKLNLPDHTIAAALRTPSIIATRNR